MPTENGNLFADHERRIESNTKLADNIHIIFVELVGVFECKRAALGNCAKVLFQLFLCYADAVIGNRQCACRFVCGDADLKISALDIGIAR